MIIAIACLMKRACAVNEPRFTYVDFLRKKGAGPDPEDFGTIYRDKTSGKEYLVSDVFAPVKGKDSLGIFSIREIKDRPAGETRFDEATFKRLVVLISAAPDVENDMIEYFRADCEKNGWEFGDFRKREGVTSSTAKTPCPVQANG